MKLRFDDRAKRDLKEIRDYLLQHAGESAANKVREHFRSRFKTLSLHPLIGIASSDAVVRILSPTRYPYRIYYAVKADTVVILHIRHTVRRPPEEEEASG